MWTVVRVCLSVIRVLFMDGGRGLIFLIIPSLKSMKYLFTKIFFFFFLAETIAPLKT